MKITYLANVRLPTERAYGIQIINMCRAFASQGAEVSLFFPFRSNPTIKKNIFEYYGVQPTFKATQLKALDFYLPGSLDKIAFHIKNLFSAMSLVWCARTQRADVVYSRDELLLFLLSFFQKNLYFEAHRFSSARNLYYRRFKTQRVKIVAISNALKEEFIGGGFRAEDIVVAPDAVDLDMFGMDLSREDARQKTGLPVDERIVMYSGHLFGRKGTDVLAQAAREVPNVLFVFVGGTDREVQEFKKKYVRIENIRILGHRPYQTIPVYLQAADILVLPNSNKESIADRVTSPLKLFEYMASHRPIIASDLPVLREVLNTSNSILVEADRPEVLARNIIRLLSDKDMQTKLSDQAFYDVSVHTWKSRTRRIMDYISQHR